MSHPLDTITQVATALRAVTGIDAVVLGGSRATDTHSLDSDIDIGIYYGASTPLDLDELNRIAHQLDDQHRLNLVTSPGGWGPWVNAGGWLTVNDTHVDLILRETNRVALIVNESDLGRVQAHYQPGHPHAFIDVMYRGELAESHMLWCESAMVSILKSRAENYPDALQRAMCDIFGFEARFSAELATKSIERNDIYYVMAHVVRSISALNQVVFALNRRYCLNEKKAVARANSFDVHPQRYQQRVESVLYNMCQAPLDTCGLLQQLVDDTLLMI